MCHGFSAKTFFEETALQVDTTGQHLRAELDGFLSVLKECVCTSLGLSEPQKEQNLRMIKKDQARLQEVHTGIEALLKENDSFSFMQVSQGTVIFAVCQRVA